MSIKFSSPKAKNEAERFMYSIFPCYNVDSWIDLNKLDSLLNARFKKAFEEGLKTPLQCEEVQLTAHRGYAGSGAVGNYDSDAYCRIYKIDEVRYCAIIQYNVITNIGERTKAEAYQMKKKVAAGEFYPVMMSNFINHYCGADHLQSIRYKTTQDCDVYIRPFFNLIVFNIQNQQSREFYELLKNNQLDFMPNDRSFVYKTSLHKYQEFNGYAFDKSLYSYCLNARYDKAELETACIGSMISLLNKVPKNMRTADTLAARWKFQKGCFGEDCFPGNWLAFKPQDENTMHVCLEFLGDVTIQFRPDDNIIGISFSYMPKLKEVDKTPLNIAAPVLGKLSMKSDIGEMIFDYNAYIMDLMTDATMQRTNTYQTYDSLDDFVDWYNNLIAKLDRMYTPDEKKIVSSAAKWRFRHDLWRYRKY